MSDPNNDDGYDHKRNQASTILYDDEMVEEIINELKRRGHIENEVE
jgi:hypothetical protein